MFPSAEEKEAAAKVGRSPSPQNSTREKSTASFSSFFSSLAESSVALASTVAASAKSLDQQYKISETVTTTATTAWEGTKKFAQDVDEKYHVREGVTTAAAATKERVASVTSTLTEKVAGSKEGGRASTSPRPTSPAQ